MRMYIPIRNATNESRKFPFFLYDPLTPQLCDIQKVLAYHVRSGWWSNYKDCLSLWKIAYITEIELI